MEWKRTCPRCKRATYHKNEVALKAAVKRNRICLSCKTTEINKRPGLRDSFVKRYATKGKNTGSKNPFYGRHHTEETKVKFRERDRSSCKTPEFKEKMSKISSGKNNPMYGRTFFDVWVKKYGVEKASELLEQKRQKNSIASSGKKNPMYGKPSPQGSGNGWSGWYKSWFFRSLRELSYVLMIEKEGLTWKSAECKELRIEYTDYKGDVRNYYADFLVSGQLLIEVKPQRLCSSKTVLAKQAAAENFCKMHNLVYEIVVPSKLKDNDIKELYNGKTIKLTDRYEKLYKEKYLNKLC